MDLFKQIITRENLYWAWSKTKQYYKNDAAWSNLIELSEFESNIDNELMGISHEIQTLKYKLKPLLPIIQPKKIKDGDKPEPRQAFVVSVRDQVAWNAIVNILGPYMEEEMPTWSYGNRLYRTVWIEENESIHLKLGAYRNSAGKIYRDFRHSWPLYRRYILLTLRKMATIKDKKFIELSDRENNLIEIEEQKPDRKKLPYLKKGYWTKGSSNVYWCGLDFSKFYPNINLSVILQTFKDYLGQDNSRLITTLKNFLEFSIDTTGYDEAELMSIGLEPDQYKYIGLPTGLMAAGFLANVAMLKVDREVIKKTKKNKISHFRYVDDHIVLAQDFNSLLEWIKLYKNILIKNNVGACLNEDKTEPKSLNNYLKYLANEDELTSTEAKKALVLAEDECKLDPRYPSPLLTMTLERVSALAQTDFQLLDGAEQQETLNQLEHLLVADIGDGELPAATRVSFAATMISILAPEKTPSSKRLNELTITINDLVNKLKRQGDTKRKDDLDKDSMSSLEKEIERYKLEHRSIKKDFDGAVEKTKRRYEHLLLKALHDYPDKLRLWHRVLEYYRTSGAKDLILIIDSLNKIRSCRPAEARYIASLLLNVMARQIMICANNIVSPYLVTPRRRRAAFVYLNAMSNLKLEDILDSSPKYYEILSSNAFRCALSTAHLIIGETEIDHKDYDIQALLDNLNKSKGLNWKSKASTDSWVKITNKNIAAWTWWAESFNSNVTSSTPGVILKNMLEKLPLDNDVSWRLIFKYPRHIPKIARASILLGDRKLKPEEYGWFYDVTWSKELSELKNMKINSEYNEQAYNKIINLRKTPDKYIPVYKWAECINKQHNESPWDPRVGEWTALEIVSQILSTNTNASAHPCEILIPKAWVIVKNDDDYIPELTWEKWRHITKENLIKYRNISVKDFRFTPRWKSTGSDLEDWYLYSYGIVLLGLLRKSFEWPGDWNIPGNDFESKYAITKIVSEIQCSSWTKAILEGCLFPKYRESALLYLFQPKDKISRDNDTTRDQVSIYNHNDLKKYINHAQNVLRSHQVTITNYQPRQLTPVNISQLPREPWQTDDEADL